MIIGVLLTFITPFVDAQTADAGSEDSHLTILRPSFANPVICAEGETIEIFLKSIAEVTPITVKLSSPFISYTLSISAGSFQDGILTHSVLIPEQVIPQIYGLYLEYSDEVIYVPNAVMIPPQETENNSFIDMIHITDTQIYGEDERTQQLEHLISEVNLLRPDLVLFTGDLVEGLTTVDGGPVGADIQFPILYEALKELNVPVLLCNGNHDFYINDYGNGVELWENYFLPIDYISQLYYKNVLFVGASTYDLTGLTAPQINDITTIFNQNSEGINIFFAHSDYASQFETVYSQGNVMTAFLGHEHIGSVYTVGTTLEIITDNSIPYPLHTSAPGHFRICRINDTAIEFYNEVESLKLFSTYNQSAVSENETKISGRIRSDHASERFDQMFEEITLPGLWELNSFENVSDLALYHNNSHTRIDIKFQNITHGLHTYTINLSKIVEITTDTTPSTQSSSQTTSSFESMSTTERSTNIFYLPLIIGLIYLNLKKRKRERV